MNTCDTCGKQRDLPTIAGRQTRCYVCAERATPDGRDRPLKHITGGFLDVASGRTANLACRDPEFVELIIGLEVRFDRRVSTCDAQQIDDARDDADLICFGCPIAPRCAAAARRERYTGVAGGLVLKNGSVVW